MTGGLDLSIKLDDEALDRALADAIKRGEDMTQPMGEIAEEWLQHARDRFAQEHDPLGAAWPTRRDNADPARKLLHLSGDLERAIVPEFGRDFAEIGVLRTAGPGRYARIHNEGGTIVPKVAKALSFGGRLVAKVVMPRRQYIGFGKAERRSAIDVLSDWARGLFGAGT